MISPAAGYRAGIWSWWALGSSSPSFGRIVLDTWCVDKLVACNQVSLVLDLSSSLFCTFASWIRCPCYLALSTACCTSIVIRMQKHAGNRDRGCHGLCHQNEHFCERSSDANGEKSANFSAKVCVRVIQFDTRADQRGILICSSAVAYCKSKRKEKWWSSK